MKQRNKQKSFMRLSTYKKSRQSFIALLHFAKDTQSSQRGGLGPLSQILCRDLEVLFHFLCQRQAEGPLFTTAFNGSTIYSQ